MKRQAVKANDKMLKALVRELMTLKKRFYRVFTGQRIVFSSLFRLALPTNAATSPLPSLGCPECILRE
jgi:hypothetical protein